MVIDAFKVTKQNGINIRAFFIIGLIYDTKETIKDTIEFAKKLNPNLAQFSFLVPFPGTIDYKIAVENNLLKPDFYLEKPISDYHNLKDPIFVPKSLDKNELLKLHKTAIKKFYFRPKYILNQMKSIKNLDYLVRNIKIGLNLLRQI